MGTTNELRRSLSPSWRNRRTSAEFSEVDRSPSGSSANKRAKRKRGPRGRSKLSDAAVQDSDFFQEWGITPEQEEDLLAEFRKAIESETGPLKPMFDTYYLRRFLRARQHNIQRAKTMFLSHLEWRGRFGADTILDDFFFEERDAFLSLYPQGYHKTDRLGRPIYIQHLGQINVRALKQVTTEERMLRYHVQEYERALRYIFPACSMVAGRYVGQTLAIMDLKGVSLRHLTGDVKRILGTITRTDQDNYPETLGKTLIINAPAIFRAIWALVKPMLDPRTLTKIEVCPPDYLAELRRWIELENIPEYLGGKSQGLLIDDVGPWSEPGIVEKLDAMRAQRDADKGSMEEAWSAIAEDSLHSPTSDDKGRISPMSLKSKDLSDISSPADRFAGHGSLRWEASRRSSTLSAVSSTGFVSATESLPEGYFSVDENDASSSAVNGKFSSMKDVVCVSSSSDEIEVQAFTHLTEPKWPSPPAQMSILSRVRALEHYIPDLERRLKSNIPSGTTLPSRTVGQGTLIARVEALEQAVGVLISAQETDFKQQNMAKNKDAKKKGCGSSCCSIM